MRVNEALCRLNDPSNTTAKEKTKIAKEEVAAKTAVGELKQAQESLRKEEVRQDVVEDYKEPTTEDIDGMMEAVLNRTRPSRGEQDEDDKDVEEADN